MWRCHLNIVFVLHLRWRSLGGIFRKTRGFQRLLLSRLLWFEFGLICHNWLHFFVLGRHGLYKASITFFLAISGSSHRKRRSRLLVLKLDRRPQVIPKSVVVVVLCRDPLDDLTDPFDANFWHWSKNAFKRGRRSGSLRVGLPKQLRPICSFERLVLLSRRRFFKEGHTAHSRIKLAIISNLYAHTRPQTYNLGGAEGGIFDHNFVSV